MMEDRLAHYPGLTFQPPVGTPECDKLEAELCFAIEDKGDETPEKVARTVQRFMIGRGYWPLGTTVTADEQYQITATFPGEPD